MDTIEMFKEILEPIGVKFRIFVMDYKDNNGVPRNQELCPVGVYSDSTFLKETIRSAEAKGFVVYAIHEILDGYRLDELEEMMDYDPQEAIRHLKPAYIKARA